MILIKIRQPPLAEFCSATNTDDAELGTLIITLSIKIHVLEIRELQFGSIRKLLWVLLLDLLPSLASLQLLFASRVEMQAHNGVSGLIQDWDQKMMELHCKYRLC